MVDPRTRVVDGLVVLASALLGVAWLIAGFWVSIRFIPPFTGWWQRYEDTNMSVTYFQHVNEFPEYLKCVAPPQSSILPTLQLRFPSYRSNRVLDDYETLDWRVVFVNHQHGTMRFEKLDMGYYQDAEYSHVGFVCGVKLSIGAERRNNGYVATFGGVDFLL
jgi:hypothetical protein